MQKLNITRALRSRRLTQKFGENKACVDRFGNITGKRNNSCPANTKDFYKSLGMVGHSGIDIAGRTGESVVHSGMFDGYMKTEKDSAGGIGVDVISHEKFFFPGSLKGLPQVEKNGKIGFETHVKIRYWHLKAAIGHDRKEIKYGQQIGLCGSTGKSSGPHLHMGVKMCDKNGRSLDIANGYYGAFDFTRYYNHDIFAGEDAKMLIPPPPLTQAEKKEIEETLSLVTRILLGLREMYFSI